MDSPEKFLFALKWAKWTQNKTFLNVTHIFAIITQISSYWPGDSSPAGIYWLKVINIETLEQGVKHVQRH